MKKKLILIIVAAFILAVLGAVLGYLLLSGNEFDRGRVIVCNENAYVFVDDSGQFWVMKHYSSSKNIFEGLQTGDEILVYRSSAMAMSYPGQCSVKFCRKLESGSVSDIPESTITELKQIGWLE